MFRLTETHLFWWPVHADVPDPDKPGKLTRQTLQMQFEALSLEEARALDDEIRAIEDPREREARQHDLLIRIARDWKDVVGDDGEPVPFSTDALKSAINVSPWFRVGAYRAFADALTGEKARLGN